MNWNKLHEWNKYTEELEIQTFNKKERRKESETDI